MSKNKRLIAASAAALALAVPAASSAAPAKLVATVGPGFTITDRSDDHNFHLRGPGLNREFTSVSFVGKKTVTLRVKAGKYSFVCDPHADEMHGAFAVR